MKKFIHLSFASLVLCLVISSCDNGAYTATPGQTSGTNPIATNSNSNNNNSSNNNNGGSNNNTIGTLTAKINGNSYSATVSFYTVTTGVLGVTGTTNVGDLNNQKQIDMAVMNYNGPGTYTLYTADYIVGTTTHHVDNSGTLVVTSEQNNILKGTFNFTTNDNYTITNGSFNVPKE